MILSEMIKEFEDNELGFYSSLIGNVDVDIQGLNLCNRKSQHESIISYAVSDKYVDIVKEADHVKALVINMSDADAFRGILEERGGAIICTAEPELYFYGLHEFLNSCTSFYNKFDFESQVGDECTIAESAVIEKGVIIGNNVVIGANTVVKRGTIIEDNVTIGCNTTIGSEGFQILVNGDKQPLHATHVGGVYISKNVYIGDNNCICNSLFEGTTFIGENVKIDNLVHVAHNLYIGRNAIITAHVILCGSSRIEEGAWIAPNSSVLNRVTIGAYSKVGMGSVVTRDVAPYTVVYGSPAKEHSKSK